MIRRATESDLPEIMEMAERFYAAAWGDGSFDPEATAGVMSRLIEHGVIFRSRRGMIGGAILPVWCAPTRLEAHEMFWWAEDGAGGALLADFEAWAADRGAIVRMSALASLRGEAVGRALRRRGYASVETGYVREAQ